MIQQRRLCLLYRTEAHFFNHCTFTLLLFFMHLSLSEKKTTFFVSFLSFFCNSPTLSLHPSLQSLSSSLLCLIAFEFVWCNLLIAWSSSNPLHTANPRQSICAWPWAGWFPGLPWRKYQMTWHSTASPGHLGELLSPYPSLGPLSCTSCFQVQGKVKALRIRSPDFTTRQAGGAVLCSNQSLTPDFCSIFSFTSSCSLIFISLSQAFTAINTVKLFF